MAVRRLSRLAIASAVLHLPWVAALGWCVGVIRTVDGPVAGEIFLLPFVVWFCTGIPAGVCGLVAWADIRASPERLRGRWAAFLGVALTAVVPVIGAVENVWGSIRQERINGEGRTPP